LAANYRFLLRWADQAGLKPANEPGLVPLKLKQVAGGAYELPENWNPPKITASAIPSPLARAEATQRVLLRWAAGRGEDNELVKGFRQLVRGIVAGAVRLVPGDIGGGAFGKLGRAIFDFESDGGGASGNSTRFLSLLKHEGKTVGATHRECLVFHGAGNTGQELQELAQTADSLDHDGTHNQLLAAWVQALRDAHLWENSKTIAWQAAIDKMLAAENVQLEERGKLLLRDDCTFVGPVMLRVKPGTGDEAYKPLYLPSYRPRAGAEFRELVQRGSATIFASGHVKLESQGGHRATICVVRGADNAQRRFLLGHGNLEWLSSSFIGSGERRNPDWRNAVAQFRQAFEEAYGRVTLKDVESCPPLYPDALRFVIRQLGEDGKFYTDAAQARLDAMATLPSRSDDVCVVDLDDSEHWFIEQHAGERVGDLHRIGHALWWFFVDREVTVSRPNRLILGQGERLLGPASDRTRSFLSANEEILDDQFRDEQRRFGKGLVGFPLARLQRFVACYTQRHDEDSPYRLLQPLTLFAAQTFARNYARLYFGERLGTVSSLGFVAPPHDKLAFRDKVELALYRDPVPALVGSR